MKKFKSLFSIILCIAILVTLSGTVFVSAAETDKKQKSYNEDRASSIDFTVDNDSLNGAALNNKKLVHNNGNPIKTSNLFKDGKSEGNNVFGVYYSIVNGVPHEDVYMSDTNKVPLSDLYSFVDEIEQENANIETFAANETNAVYDNSDTTFGVLAISPVNDYVRSYNWSFSNDGIQGATLSTSV